MEPDLGEMTPKSAFAADFERFYAESAVPALIVDVGRRAIVDANAASLSFLGLEVHEVVGRPGADFLTEPTEDEVLRVRSLRGDTTMTVRRVSTLFGVRTVELRIVPGGPEGIIFVQVVDLTDILDAATQAQERADSEARARRALEEVTSRVAHDLRSPLASIAGFADLLVSRGDSLSESRRTDMLERIAANAHALAAHASAVVAQARGVEVGAGGDVRTPSALFQIVESMVDAEVHAAGVTLHFDDGEVSELPAPAARLASPLVNLVSNAIKYRVVGRPLTVRVATRSDDGWIEITVTDDGPGLGDSEAAEALFDVGTRGAATEGVTGSGLGLAFVRAMAEGLGGSARAETVGPDGGARFVLRLPLLVAPEAGHRRVGFHSGLTARQLDHIIEVSPVPTMVIDLSIRSIIRVNGAACDLLERDADEVVGRPGTDFADEVELADAIRDELLISDEARSSVTMAVRAKSGPVQCLVSGSKVPQTAMAVIQLIPL